MLLTWSLVDAISIQVQDGLIHISQMSQQFITSKLLFQLVDLVTSSLIHKTNGEKVTFSAPHDLTKYVQEVRWPCPFLHRLSIPPCLTGGRFPKRWPSDYNPRIQRLAKIFRKIVRHDSHHFTIEKGLSPSDQDSAFTKGRRFAVCLQRIRETIRFIFVRAVGKNSGESRDWFAKSTAVGGVEDYHIKGYLIQEIGLESMTVTWFRDIPF